MLLGGTDKDSCPGTSTAVDWSLLDGFIGPALKRIPKLSEGRLAKDLITQGSCRLLDTGPLSPARLFGGGESNIF